MSVSAGGCVTTQPLCDRDAGALVAVDAADDERLASRVGVARFDGGDRAAVDGATEQDGAADGCVGGRRGVDRSRVRGRGHGERAGGDEGAS